jgi:hypothetical protein
MATTTAISSATSGLPMHVEEPAHRFVRVVDEDVDERLGHHQRDRAAGR